MRVLYFTVYAKAMQLLVWFYLILNHSECLSLSNGEGEGGLLDKIATDSIEKLDFEDGIMKQSFDQVDLNPFEKYNIEEVEDFEGKERTKEWQSNKNTIEKKHSQDDSLGLKNRTLDGIKHLHLTIKRRKKKRETETSESYSTNEGFGSFKGLRFSKGYIDKTRFILDFHLWLSKATLITRPKRSGKTQCLWMLRDFYCIPEIDIDTYDPLTGTHCDSNGKAEELFKDTDVFDPIFRENYIKDKKQKVHAADFIKENMGKWPAIYLNFASVSFATATPSSDEILETIFTNAI